VAQACGHISHEAQSAKPGRNQPCHAAAFKGLSAATAGVARLQTAGLRQVPQAKGNPGSFAALSGGKPKNTSSSSRAASRSDGLADNYRQVATRFGCWCGRNALHYPKWKTVPYFLSDYTQLTIYPPWAIKKSKSPLASRHTILQWYTVTTTRFQREIIWKSFLPVSTTRKARDRRGLIAIRRLGRQTIYLHQHNGELLRNVS